MLAMEPEHRRYASQPAAAESARPVRPGTDLVSYLAKYFTKGTETTGHVSARITADTIDLSADPGGTHPERRIAACWSLGQHPDYASLQRWAHMLGFGSTS